MRQGLLLFASGLSLWVLSSCATSYHQKGFTGGYSETQLAPDVFRVNFQGNGYTSAERAQDFVLLRAAELSLERGFRYFALLDEESSSKLGIFTTPGSAHTTGSAYRSGNSATYSGYTTYTPGHTFLISKPHTGVLVRGFTNKPDDIYTFDTEFLQQSLKRKYSGQR
jgi:hypothetical protein